jgi:imidazolonepropionase-like amidohydrolase
MSFSAEIRADFIEAKSPSQFSLVFSVLLAGLATASPTFGQSASATIASQSASIHVRMSSDSPVIATLQQSAPVAVQFSFSGRSGCWLEVKWSGGKDQTGYVPCQDVRQVAAANQAPKSSAVAPSNPVDVRKAPTETIAKGSPATPGTIALTHIRVIDGTGSPSKDDQTILIARGRIREIGNSSSVGLTGVAQTLDLRGYTALPGFVGMHEHLFYTMPTDASDREMLATFPKLYLASGVTTIRTAGNLNLRAELGYKQQIDQGKEIGPHVYLSGYVDADPSLPENPGGLARAAERMIAAGIRSIKIYNFARRSELAAIIQVAHQHGATVTGHLCATGFTEAAEAGIDNLEHGLIVDTEFFSGKQPGDCPDWTAVVSELVQMDVRGPQIRALIQRLVQRHVAITSTLAVFETLASNRIPQLDPRTVSMLAPEIQAAYLEKKTERLRSGDRLWGAMLKKEMEFERAFAAAGGLLMAGVDPTGWGGVIAGYGDQRELELLVETGFSPEQAIQIATYNGAYFLGLADRLGTLSAGKNADITVIRGNPDADIRDIRQTQLVFKDGVAYNSGEILQAVEGQVGR